MWDLVTAILEMGVPAFFRWLSRKYPSIVANCVEEKNKGVDKETVPIDCTQPNPNGIEFDNLYLDMNGIIHPCCHPEDKPAPTNEDEMMIAIFEYIDRLFSIIRPRRLLYMAIDGVAPKAKMNQQRSRRFRAAKESQDKTEAIAKIRAQLEARGIPLPPEKKGEHFDSNCITPGTPFMSRLAVCLKYYIHDRMNNDPSWKGIAIILSDANVPGEGEHKIMDFIRRQRASSTHDPNTHHVLCGADADLIMLGLATHEPNFTIIREEFIPQQQRPCELCGQYGHEMKDCQGLASLPTDEYDDLAKPFEKQTNFIFIRLSVLREYLKRDLAMPNLPFTYDFERVLDDWVFMCFFVGNDFLPHLPSLEIREGAIDRLIKLYMQCVYKTGGYLTSSGSVNLNRVQVILSELGGVEDEIFRTRQHTEMERKRKEKMRKLQVRGYGGPSYIPSNDFSPMVLWESGWKERYYQSKFEVPLSDQVFRKKVAHAYVEGLCWVLKYYYQGCPSWTWFYPFHYSPFASDFTNIGDMKIEFPKDTHPVAPLEQLMSVLPAASRAHLPQLWADLMIREVCDV
ncbi:unnamed protein product [Soboliphyme baturini]|uniref:CCHC-type domain-containing protein n=1 Tax=Soboliphyme baturini TaxID=241478 RepID=A0A183J2P0_9BILA|nr:unnamed protein product [Soboliphyme baturini]